MPGFDALSIFRLPNMPLKAFEPVLLSHLLKIAAIMPVSTRILIGRVAGMHSICDKDSGSNPLSGMLGKWNMDRGLNPSTVQPTEHTLSPYLNACYLRPITTIGKESGGVTLI